jgi:hypothetical protein
MSLEGANFFKTQGVSHRAALALLLGVAPLVVSSGDEDDSV